MFTLLVPHALAYTLMFLFFNTTMHNNVPTHIKQPPVTQKSKRRNSKKQKTKYHNYNNISSNSNSNSNSNGNNNKFNKLCFFFQNVAFFFQRKEKKKQHKLITQTLCRQSMSGGASLTLCLTLSFLIFLLLLHRKIILTEIFLLYFTITTHRHLKMPKPLYGEQTNQ